MSERGITLIELMVTVAIIGVLAAIAIPSYQSYLVRGAVTDAKGCLTEAIARAERFYTRNNRYPDTIGALYGDARQSFPCGEQRDYDLRLAASAAACPVTSCVEVLATPVTSRATAGGSLGLQVDARRPLATRETRWHLKPGESIRENW